MILVTGGTGMLGAHLLYHLTENGYKVRALKRSTSKVETVKYIFSFYKQNYEKQFSEIEWFEANILNYESLFQALAGIDEIYHVAAMVSFDPRDKQKMIKNNIKGTQNIVDAALVKKIRKFCHVSSISALGEAEQREYINEETFRNPKGKHSGYSISKYFSELEVWRGITEGLNAVIVNPSIILGPGDWQKGSPSIFNNINKGLKFYTKGITGYVDVLDVVKIMVKLMKSDIQGERFIVSAENLSFKQFFSEVAEALGVKKPTINANSLMLSLAWRLESLRSLLTGSPPLITKDSTHSAQQETLYSNQKLLNSINYNFTPISKSIKNIAQIFKNNISNK